MSDSLIPLSGGGRLPGRVERQLVRDMAVDHAAVERLRARESAKIEAMGELTLDALTKSAEIVNVHGLLCENLPHGAAIFTTITQSGTMGLAEVVMRAGRRLA